MLDDAATPSSTATRHVSLLVVLLALKPKTYTGWAKKRGHTLMTIILSNLNRFLKLFTGRFLGKFVVKWTLQISPHLAYVATLPYETLMSAKQAVNDKLQGIIACLLYTSPSPRD